MSCDVLASRQWTGLAEDPCSHSRQTNRGSLPHPRPTGSLALHSDATAESASCLPARSRPRGACRSKRRWPQGCRGHPYFTEVFSELPPYRQKDLLRLVLHKAVLGPDYVKIALCGRPPGIGPLAEAEPRSTALNWLLGQDSNLRAADAKCPARRGPSKRLLARSFWVSGGIRAGFEGLSPEVVYPAGKHPARGIRGP